MAETLREISGTRKRRGNVRYPHWDACRRVLLWGNQVILRLARRAPNQEAVLETFENHAWPHRIDDPLPYQRANQKRRLHDTIKCLNRGARNIRFRGDGTAEGVIWERE